MEVEQMIQLMRAVKENELTDFSYEENGICLKIKKHPEKKILAPAMPSLSGTSSEPVYTVTQSVSAPASDEDTEREALPAGNVVKCPLVGTFYAASTPDAAPFVREGDTVTKGQTLAIVEAMKLMNEIESEYSGTVKKVLVKNGDTVEFDQPLFVIG